MMGTGELVLASGSARRRRMLDEAGVAVTIQPADLDDGTLQPGPVDPRWWVASLAYFKARRVADHLAGEDASEAEEAGGRGGERVVLGADTVCVVDGCIIGQPADEAAARATLRSMTGRAHDVLTGVAVVGRPGGGHTWFVDAATVHLGDLSDREIDAYLETGKWRGKAGGYNLEERLAAGWPVRCDGDPTTVVGLPMQRLGAWLDPWRRADES